MEIKKQTHIEQVIGGNKEDVKFRINTEKSDVLIEALINLYSNPIGSIVREITCNCIDAVREKYLKINGLYPLESYEDKKFFKQDEDLPVIIEYQKDNILLGIGESISFTDYGVGLSYERIVNTYTVFGASTKNGSNLEIGGYGLGAKSVLAYTDTFYVSTAVNGTLTSYMLYKDNKGITLKEVFVEQDLQKYPHNYTVVTIPFKEQTEKYADSYYKQFVNAINEQLYYFDTISFKGFKTNDINNSSINGTESIVYEDNDFLFNVEDSVGILIDKVKYPIDTYIIKDISKVNALGLNIKFKIGELDLTPSRESIRYTEDTKKRIEDKLVILKNLTKIELRKECDLIVNTLDINSMYRLLYNVEKSYNKELVLSTYNNKRLAFWYNINNYFSLKVPLFENFLIDNISLHTMIDIGYIDGIKFHEYNTNRNHKVALGYTVALKDSGTLSTHKFISSSKNSIKYLQDKDLSLFEIRSKLTSWVIRNKSASIYNGIIYVTDAYNIDLNSPTFMEDFKTQWLESNSYRYTKPESYYKESFAHLYFIYKKYLLPTLDLLDNEINYVSPKKEKEKNVYIRPTDTIFYRALNIGQNAFRNVTLKYEELEKLQDKTLFIYGFKDDEVDLQHMAYLLNYRAHINIVKISTEAEKFFIKNSIYVKDVIKMKHESIKKAYTARLISESNILTPFSFLKKFENILPNYYQLYQEIKSFHTNNYPEKWRQIPQEIIDYLADEKIFIQEILDKVELIKNNLSSVQFLNDINYCASYYTFTENEKVVIETILEKFSIYDIDSVPLYTPTKFIINN